MADENTLDIALVASPQRQLLGDIGTMRDDMGITTAILQRLYGTVAGLVNEIRATHSQRGRSDRPVSELAGRL